MANQSISEHSNPTGLSLAEDRRGPLVELARRWSKRRRIYVLEDAAYVVPNERPR